MTGLQFYFGGEDFHKILQKTRYDGNQLMVTSYVDRFGQVSI